MMVPTHVTCDECNHDVALDLQVVDAGQLMNGVLVTWQQLLDTWDASAKQWIGGPEIIPAPHWCELGKQMDALE